MASIRALPGVGKRRVASSQKRSASGVLLARRIGNRRLHRVRIRSGYSDRRNECQRESKSLRENESLGEHASQRDHEKDESQSY